jgi:TonB family protein
MRVAAVPSIMMALCLTSKAQPPQILSRVDPAYSDEARTAKVNANVLMVLVVGIDGIPQDVHILRAAGFGLDETAVEAVRLWRFQPGLKAGVAVPERIDVEVGFSLIAPDHDGQTVRLEFGLPAHGERPVLLYGEIPGNPEGNGPDRVRLGFTVGVDGAPGAVSILESSSAQWAVKASQQVAGWHFRPGTVNGIPAEMNGILEINRRARRGESPDGGSLRNAEIISIRSPEVEDPALPAAHLLAPPDRVELEIFPRRTAFSWEPVPGAASYILEWDYSYDGVWHAEAEKTPGTGYLVTGTEFIFEFVGAQPGRWRVWPVNGEGKRGTPSEWRTFRYNK